MDYPKARRLDLIDTLHDARVPDPFRWLEDDAGADTRAWVDAENALTRSVLDGAPRDALLRRLAGAYDHPRTTSFAARSGREFFTRNPGLINQPILYVRDARRTADAPAQSAEERVLLDPNTLTTDGTTALTAYFPSDDGRLMAYALSVHGSDRQEIRVRDVETGEDRDDRLAWVKFASVAWTNDGAAFFYLRFPEPGSVPAADEQYFGRIYFHRLGDPQDADVLVFDRPHQKEVVPLVDVSHSGRWIVITAQRGASDDSEVYVAEVGGWRPEAEGPQLAAGSWQLEAPTWRALFTGFDAAYHFIGEAAGSLLFRTTKDAPMGRVVAVDPDHPERGPHEIVPESEDRLSLGAIAHETLVLSYLHNASDRMRLFDLSGAPCGELLLPGIGSIVTLDATPDDDSVRVVYTSFADPPTARVLPLKREANETTAKIATTRAPAYETRQVWYRSKDGTRVSMFLVHRADLAIDGARRVLLSGYGGFNISRTPAFDPGNVPFLDDGGVFALANLRGGGEYGETWHRAGMLEQKQNVFDDFIAAAEFLIASGYTTPDRLAIEGGSNGGLLVAAVMLQRPDLFGAVICRVPVADMLRYHLFTVGRFWIPEYGSADDPAQFAFLLRYSPYHNVRAGVRYPPALVMTADTDDRVAPGMAKKFAARLQAEASGGPFLIRVETKAGHGMGKPVTKVIEEDADIFTFMDKYLGASPGPPA
jgi:prolyl oligopeptidase